MLFVRPVSVDVVDVRRSPSTVLKDLLLQNSLTNQRQMSVRQSFHGKGNESLFRISDYITKMAVTPICGKNP